VTERLVETRLVKLRLTLHADPFPLRAAVRAAGLEDERVDVTPPMEEGEDADGSIDLLSLVEIADVLRNLEPRHVKDACLWVCPGESRSDPVWCEIGISGGGFAQRAFVSNEPDQQLMAVMRVRTDLLAEELAKRIERARVILAGREVEGGAA